MIIVSVFATVLLGIVAMSERARSVEEFAAASARAAAVAAQEEADAHRRALQAAAPPTPSPTPAPPVNAAGPGTYTVQVGDSLFSVAAELGLTPNELVAWNMSTYPTLQSTPALEAGWVLVTAGPPLATPEPRPTPVPAPPSTHEPQVAGPGTPVVPVFGPGAFPASHAVTVSYYAVSGSSASEISASIDANGPWSDWLGTRATAHVEVRPSFNFSFASDGYGGCEIVSTGPIPVTATYNVVLPSWTPPAGISSRTVDWWIESIHETVAHEGQHITIYESFLPTMNQAVQSGTCATVSADLEALTAAAHRSNCEFDLAEYASVAGYTLESCISG